MSVGCAHGTIVPLWICPVSCSSKELAFLLSLRRRHPFPIIAGLGIPVKAFPGITIKYLSNCVCGICQGNFSNFNLPPQSPPPSTALPTFPLHCGCCSLKLYNRAERWSLVIAYPWTQWQSKLFCQSIRVCMYFLHPNFIKWFPWMSYKRAGQAELIGSMWWRCFEMLLYILQDQNVVNRCAAFLRFIFPCLRPWYFSYHVRVIQGTLICSRSDSCWELPFFHFIFCSSASRAFASWCAVTGSWKFTA